MFYLLRITQSCHLTQKICTILPAYFRQIRQIFYPNWTPPMSCMGSKKGKKKMCFLTSTPLKSYGFCVISHDKFKFFNKIRKTESEKTVFSQDTL